jgi:type IV secretion system protein VirB10
VAGDEPTSRSSGDERPRRDGAPVLVRNPTAVSSSASSPEPGVVPPWSIPLAEADLAGLAARAPAPAAAASHPRLVEAAILPERRFLLPRGSFLDCTLETAIDSTLPGLATCILAADVYGADGRVVLMERGTRLIGEARADVRSGQNRVAVIWQDARTPTGVRLELASAGTDALGRAGVPGRVDRHLADRFGAAVLLSFVDAGASAIAARREAQGAILYNPQASRDIATEALRNSIGIPPTIRIEPGARIQVIVASDVSFRNVYRLVAHDP